VFLQDFFIRMFTITHVLEYVFIIGVLFPPAGAKQTAYKKGSSSQEKRNSSKLGSQPQKGQAGRKARGRSDNSNRPGSSTKPGSVASKVDSTAGKDTVVQINSARATTLEPQVE
jgi:hypothetical protein